MKEKANMIWLWGQGKKPKMKKFPLKGSVITAVDLIKGIGKAIEDWQIGIGLISRHIEKLAGLTPRPTLMNTGAALSSRSRRAPYLTRPAG